ncbi:MAG: nucleoside hydrolase [Candidatus Aenigmatarchaeota archaeon]
MPERLLVVTDPLNDCDDMVALYMLKDPRLQCEGVITTYGNAKTRAKGARKLLDIMDKNDIPVFYGNHSKARPHSPYHMHEAAYGFLTDSELKATDKEFGINPDGEEFMVHTIKTNPGDISILSIAPLTVLTTVLHSVDPKLIKSVYMMGGHVGGYSQKTTMHYNEALMPEYNFECDPQAAREVLGSGVGIKMIGKNLWSRDLFTLEDFEQLADGSAAQKTILSMVKARYTHNKRNLEPLGIKVETLMYDPVTLGTVLFPELYEFRKMDVCIDETGLTTAETGTGNITAAVAANLPAVKKNLLELINKK